MVVYYLEINSPASPWGTSAMFMSRFFSWRPHRSVPTKSIKQQFFLLVLAMGLPLLACVIANAIYQAGIERDDAEREAMGVAHQVASRLDDHLFHMQSLLYALSPNVSFGANALAANQNFLDKEARVLPAYVSDIALWDLHGVNLGSTDPGLRAGSTLTDQADVHEALRTGAFIVKAPGVASSRHERNLHFAAPVLDTHGTVVGVITASTPLLQLQPLVKSVVALPADTVISILDDQGMILARSTDPVLWIGKSVANAATSDEQSGVMERTHLGAGIDGIVRVIESTSATRAPWRVFVGIPASTIYGPARRHAEQAVAIGGLALLFCFLIAWRMGKSFSRPIIELAEQARQFQHGNLRDRGHSHGPSEIIELRGAIHHMADALVEREEAAARSERWLRQITDALPALIAYIDTDQRYLLANRFYEGFGCDPPAMIGRTVDEVQGEGRYRGTEGYFKRALSGEYVTFEHSTVVPDGSPRHLLANYIPDFAASGEVQGLFILHHDITALKTMTRKLELSEARTRAITNNLPIRIAYMDHEHRMTFANEAFAAFCKRSVSDVLDAPFEQVLGSEAYAATRPHLQRALAGEMVRFERTHQADGCRVVDDVTYAPDIDESGTVRGIYGMSYDITALKDVQAALARSERHLRGITDNLPAIVCYVDKQERLRFVNAYMGRAIGADPQQLLGNTVHAALGEVLYKDLAPQIARALHGETVNFEGSATVLGTRTYYQADYIPDFAEDGSVAGFYAMTFDISQRKQAELALSREKEALAVITDNAPALISYIDAQQRLQFINKTFTDWFGGPGASLVGLSLEELYGSAAYQLCKPHIDQALQGRRIEYEHLVETKLGSKAVQVVAVPDFDQGTTVRGLFVVMTDITQLKAAEIRQKASEAQLRTITNNLPALVCYIDQSHTFRFNNQTYERWLRRPTSEITGRPVADVYGEVTYAKLAPTLERALAGEPMKFDVEFPGRNGTIRTARGTYIPDVAADGSVSGVYGLINDVTDLKRAEEKLWRLAQFDNLTGLPNRSQFNERLAECIEDAERRKIPLALMFLDIDKFKSINDEHGHQVGDAVLVEFATRLRWTVRASDVVARLGGDEFVILLTSLHGAEEAQFVARKIIHAMKDRFIFKEIGLRVSSSIGVAMRAAGERDSSALLRRADQALYAAKAAGRDNFKMSA